MNISVWIEPHERFEAVEAYKSWLSEKQVEEIEDAPESALIHLSRERGITKLTIVEEG